MKKPKTNKEKQWIQNKKVLLYKPYKVEPLRPKTPKPTFIQDEIDNLDKYIENKINNIRMK